MWSYDKWQYHHLCLLHLLIFNSLPSIDKRPHWLQNCTTATNCSTYQAAHNAAITSANEAADDSSDFKAYVATD
jgi:hypothetical protein